MENKYNIFNENLDPDILYLKFINIYIPVINKKIILNSLDLINNNSIKIKIYKKLGLFIPNRLNLKILDHINFKKYKSSYKRVSLNKDIENELKLIKNYNCCAIYTGNEDITDKYVLQLMDNKGSILGYGKVAKDVYEENMILKEIENLKYLENLNINSAKIPKILHYNKEKNIYIQSTQHNLKRCNKINNKHINFLAELYEKTNKTYDFDKTEIYNHFIEIRDKVENKMIKDVSKRALNKINLNEIKCCYSHGDFYPQNVKIYKDIVYVYDWVDGGIKHIYYDMYHYMLNNNIVRNKIEKKILINDILNNNKKLEYFEKKLQISSELRIPMLILYLHEIIYEFSVIMNVDINEDGTLINYINTLNILLDSI